MKEPDPSSGRFMVQILRLSYVTIHLDTPTSPKSLPFAVIFWRLWPAEREERKEKEKEEKEEEERKKGGKRGEKARRG
jgi:hypothetical protein